MSGTSTDGMDLCYSSFQKKEERWEFEILATQEYKYQDDFKRKLIEATSLSGLTIHLLSNELGLFFGEKINHFLQQHNINPKDVDAVASHGHTVFHQPNEKFTLQIGNGTRIAQTCGIPVINDFRVKDVFLGGQGAPLVPIGDALLFSDQAEAYLNIGGFTNISFQKNNIRTAFDICAGNLPLNRIMEKDFNCSFDKNGEKAKTGKINHELLTGLNSLPYFKLAEPKSLGTEWLDSEFTPIYSSLKINSEDILRTLTEHIAQQIGAILDKNTISSVLLTGGGAKNTFLVNQIKNNTSSTVLLPSEEIIDFKEALIFGFLGALYLEKEHNVLKEVTGASRNSCSGVLHLP